MSLPVRVRPVWHHNLVYEFQLIRSALSEYSHVAFDTEFPGTVYDHPPYLSPRESYAIMKKNVDSTKLIQLGLTLSDAEGRLPDFGSGFCYVWEFNFRDFDVEEDVHNRDSIILLMKQGINFLNTKEFGIFSCDFALCCKMSGLTLPHKNRTWVTFHGTYDFGYLIKVLYQCELPDNLSDFMDLLKGYFGNRLFDMKEMIGFCGLKGGLDRIGKSLNVGRSAGKSHQAGSDSLLTMQVFLELKNVYFGGTTITLLDEFNYALHGLAPLIDRVVV